MGKLDLIATVAAQAGLPKPVAARAVETVFAVITEAFTRSDDVPIVGFGSFLIDVQPGRLGRNPRTGGEIRVAPSVTVRFNAAKDVTRGVQRAAMTGG